jgi:pimeloyl-ACP methyl ester carboxylesterase
MTTVQELVSHRWRVPAESFTTLTEDGVEIVGTALRALTGETDPAPAQVKPAMVLAHGLMGWHRKPKFAVFAELLTPWFDVYPFDLRGHGDSGGESDFGKDEVFDVEAVLRHARVQGHGTVVTAGASLGGISVIRHGALLGGSDCVVGISSLAWWSWRDEASPVARRRMDSMILTSAGRAALRAMGVRLVSEWDEPESPQEVIGKVAPTPVLIVHGEDDRLFPPMHAHALYEAAGEPKRLLLGRGFGHAEDGLSPAFAQRMAGWVYELLGRPWTDGHPGSLAGDHGLPEGP